MSNLEIRTIPSGIYFCVARSVIVSEIRSFADDALPPLLKMVSALNLDKRGPVEFHYIVASDGAATFRMEIAQPVDQARACSDPFYFKRSPEFRCVSRHHRGSIRSIGQDWDFFAIDVRKAGFQPSGEIREVYRYWESLESYRNITELQFGII